jgi:predicted transcriptional regulator
MKTTIDIADDLFERVQRLAEEQGTTLRALTEEGLRLVLDRNRARPTEIPPLVVFGEGGLADEFKEKNWNEIRQEIYREHGA